MKSAPPYTQLSSIAPGRNFFWKLFNMTFDAAAIAAIRGEWWANNLPKARAAAQATYRRRRLAKAQEPQRRG
jgi:hypothetical protein